ncbi:uncharacterized protein LOC130667940 [Microplitis mediator]|uniref:uncharacterized protein LOC130667940 n=1 Tax=Microplitis mediator TaxID=375433 RepID=UPI00255782D3|nr:uncharacterized protein LOC130667940 [Microplitis mediator]
MDHRICKNKILPSNNIIETLMKVSQLNSSSSSSSSRSNYSSCLNNQNISYQKLHDLSHKLSTETKYSIKNFKKLTKNYNIIKDFENAVRRKLHEKLVKLEWNNYVQWKILLTFSLGLWILLCITDKIFLRTSAPSSSKEEKIPKIPNNIPETINLNLSNENKFLKWVYTFYPCIYRTTTVSNSTEAYTFALFIGIFICMETRLKQKFKNTRDAWTQYCDDFIKIQSLNLDDCNTNKLAIELFNGKSQNKREDLSNLSENISNNIKILPFKKFKIESDLYWQLQMLVNDNEITYNVENTDDNYLKQLEIINQVKKIDNESIYHWNKLIKNNICVCHDKSLVYNFKYSSNSVNIVETYDLEIGKFINYSNDKTVTFDKSTDTQLDKSSSRIEFKKPIIEFNNNNTKKNNRSLINKIKNNRMISSSPAFQKFLLKL